MEKSTVRQVVPLQPMEVNGGADLVLQPMEDPTLEQFVPKGLHHMEKTHSGAACEERQPMENFMEDRLLWGGPQAGARDECEEEGEAETKLWTDFKPHFPSPCTAGKEEVENTGVKVSPGRREGWGGGIFKVWFYFSLSVSDLFGDKLISPSAICFACDSNRSVMSSCPYLDPRAFHCISPLSSWGGGGLKQLWWAPSIQPS